MREWSYFQNPFINATVRNFKKGIHISTFTDARLYAKGEVTSLQIATMELSGAK